MILTTYSVLQYCVEIYYHPVLTKLVFDIATTVLKNKN